MRSVSVVVATRNRGQRIVTTIDSLLACAGVDIDLVIVDQSTDDRTAAAVRPYLARGAPLRFVRSSTVGQSRAINEAVALARHEIVAMTDDDCEVPVGWLTELLAAFDEHLEVGVVFCRVVAGPHDKALGWTPEYRCRGEHVALRWSDRRGRLGMGAGMAARRRRTDRDRRIRRTPRCRDEAPRGQRPRRRQPAMIAGWAVLETDRTEVVHHGFRTMAEGRTVTTGWIGIGAMYAKLARTGHVRWLLLGCWDVLTLAMAPALRDLARLRKPRTLRRLSYFLRGFASALNIPIDPDRLVFTDA